MKFDEQTQKAQLGIWEIIKRPKLYQIQNPKPRDHSQKIQNL
jgi:hypothetical protein